MKKLIKLLFKILALPIIAVLFLVCLLGKAATYVSAYFFGPVMLIVLIAIIVFATKARWTDCAIFGGVELACLVAIFGTTWVILNLEDLRKWLCEFVCS